MVSTFFKSALLLGSFLVYPLFAAGAPWVGVSLEGVPCWGSIQGQGYGPYNYTNPIHRKSNLQIVEKVHFTPDIEQLTGRHETALYNNINYTLTAFPNHHRALQSMTILQIRKKKGWKKTRTPIECYYERAINFDQNDGTAQLLYAIYLHRSGKYLTALEHYQSAEKLQPSNRELHYNLALLYFDLKRYKQAHQHAVKAYESGYPLLGLKNKLTKLGYWKMPTD